MQNWWMETKENCSVAGAMAVLGDKWTLLILRDAINGVSKFDDFQEHLGAPRAMLSKRLDLLEKEGIMEKHPYQVPGERQRFEYKLTPKGWDLQHIMIALMEWGDKHITEPQLRPVELVERDSGEPVRLQLVRKSDNQLVDARNIMNRPGPGIAVS
ncbi:MAG: helix-turn-helix transcriptional regulator [Rhodospirillales bacterium]|nr:helix-turn-helix transcriptional regulator [Rhodospirillales bacterium]